MAVRITVHDQSTGNSVDIDIEPSNTVDEVIESVANFWEKDLGAYAVSYQNTVLQGETQLGSLQLAEGDTLEFIMDPQGG